MPDKQNNNGTANWFRLTWPVLAFTVTMALAGIGAHYKQDTSIAVIESENKFLKQEIGEIKDDVKAIKSFLMNPVR